MLGTLKNLYLVCVVLSAVAVLSIILGVSVAALLLLTSVAKVKTVIGATS